MQTHLCHLMVWEMKATSLSVSSMAHSSSFTSAVAARHLKDVLLAALIRHPLLSRKELNKNHSQLMFVWSFSKVPGKDLCVKTSA